MSSARASNSCSAASWLRLIALSLLFLSPALAAVCEDAGIALRLSEPGPLEAHARQTLSLMLFVDNLGGEPRELVLETLLPEEWRELTADGSFRVPAGVTESRLVGVLVSPRARAGTYPVSFRVRSATGPPAEARVEMQVVVLPEPAVAIRLLESPAFVVTGDAFRALFSLVNPGNTDLWIELRAESRPDLALKLRGVEDPGRMLLPVGEQREVEVEADAPRGLRASTHATLTLTARLLELPELRPATASAHVEIVPVSAGSAGLLRTLGGYSETTAAASLDAAPDGYLQTSFSASGALDAEGRQLLAVEIRKRLDTGDQTFANPIDRFSLAYRNRATELLLGDHSYSLSPLLAMNELGRGAQASVSLGPIGFKAQYFEDYWWEPGLSNLGLSADYTLQGKGDPEVPLYRAGLSLLSSLDGRAAYGLWQRFNPGELLSLQLDAALQSDADGSVSPALYAEAEGDQGNLYYRARFLRAWTGFEENYADTQSFLLSGGLRLLDRELNLRAAYQITDDNLELNPLLTDADRDRRMRVGATLARLPWGAQLSLDWENNLKLDRLVPADYHSLENLVRLGWKQHLGRSLGLRFDTALGRIEYPLTGNGAFSQSHAIALSYQPSAGRQADASVSFVGQRGSTGSAWYTLGWNAGVYRGWERTRLSGRLLNRYYFSDSGLSSLFGGFESTFAHSLRWGHSLYASGYFGLSYDVQRAAVPDLRLTIRYGAPLNIPVGRRPEVAVLRGRVYRVQSGEPVRGLVLRLDGQAAATNSKGEYAFHLLQAGKMYLQMDRGGLPADLIPNRPIPIEVNVAGKDSRLDIGLVRSGEVLGAVVGYGLPEEVSPFAAAPSKDSTKGPRHVRQGGFGNVLIELSDGVERRRRLTGPNGEFRFPELRPGHYTLTVGEGFIPRYYELEQPVRELDIAPGQQETVEIRAVQDQRRVRLVQAEMAVVLESPAAQRGEWTVTLQPESRQPPAAPPQAESAPQPAAAATTREEPGRAAPAKQEPGPQVQAPPAPAAAPASAPEAAPQAAPEAEGRAPMEPVAPTTEAARAPAEPPKPPEPQPAPPAAATAPEAAAFPPAAIPPIAPPAAAPPAAPKALPPAAAPQAASKAPPPAAARPAAPKASPPAAPKAPPSAAPKAAPEPASKAAPSPSGAPTPAPKLLVLPAPQPTPNPSLFVPGPTPTPTPLPLAPVATPVPRPFLLPAPEPTPVPFFFLLTPAPTPSPEQE